MGLCCSSCLLGPCRISPFERDSAKGPCGDNADMVVAKNLLRLVAREAASGLKDLGEAVRNLGASASTEGTRKVPAREVKDIIQKYGLTSRVSLRRLNSYLLRESERLLSTLSEPGRPSPLVSSLYPEGAFPYIDRDAFLPDSLTNLIFDAFSHDQNESSAVEVILWQCLKTSVITFISEELRQDMHYLTHGEWLLEIETEALDVVDHPPPKPLPVVVLFSREDGLHKGLMNRTAQDLQQELKGDVLHFRIRDIGHLPTIGRRFFQKWSLSVAEVGAIVVAFSQSTASVLGALACGFTVVSLPALPIHGSDVVEKFFCVDLKEKLGSVYLPPRAGEVLPVILEYLGRKV